jgi:hypothetical protein
MNKTVLIVSADTPLVNQLARACESLDLQLGVPTEPVNAEVLFNHAKPVLLCIDASGMTDSAMQVLFRPYVREAYRHHVPLVVCLQRGQRPVFDCPDDLCVYCLVKRPQMGQAWTAVLCELLDIESQIDPACQCS